MPIQHAVLALLADGPSHGYELKSRFESAIGPQWGPMNIGHVYQVLDRLIRDDLVIRERVQQTDRPDKHIYELTEAGERELQDWAAAPHMRQTGYRDELFLKLFAATKLGPDVLAHLVRTQREVYLTELAGLAELRPDTEGDPLISLLVDAAILHTKADLSVVEAAGERLPATASAVLQTSEATPVRARGDGRRTGREPARGAAG